MVLIKSNEFHEYAEEIPEELKRAIKALSDDCRLAIISGLIRHGELSFSQLRQGTGGTSGALSHHLRILKEAGLIENYYAKKPDINEYSLYALTSFGDSFTKNIFHSIDLSPRIDQADTLSEDAHIPTKSAILSEDKNKTKILVDSILAHFKIENDHSLLFAEEEGFEIPFRWSRLSIPKTSISDLSYKNPNVCIELGFFLGNRIPKMCRTIELRSQDVNLWNKYTGPVDQQSKAVSKDCTVICTKKKIKKRTN